MWANDGGTGVMVQKAKLFLGMPESHIRIPGVNPDSSTLSSLPADVFWEAAQDGLNTLVPAVHVGDQDGALCS